MIILLSLSAAFTATISAITGMGGGILLLSLMTTLLPIAHVIPLHGMVQLVSNLSRVTYLKNDIKVSYVKFFLIGLPIGAFISVKFIAPFISTKLVYILIALIISYTLFKPKKLPTIKLEGLGWSIVGLVAGVLAITIGAVGPFLAMFYVRDDLDKKQVIATKAAMQTLTHLIKIPAFLLISFNYLNYSYELLAMCLSVIVGTRLGIIVLEKIDDKVFRKVFKLCLGVALLRILYKAAEF